MAAFRVLTIRWKPRATPLTLGALTVVLVGLAGLALMVDEAFVGGTAPVAAAGPVPPASPSNAGGGTLRVGGAGAVASGLRATAGIAFAPGYASWRRREVVANLSGPLGQSGAGTVSLSELRWAVAEAAACSWARSWLASEAGDDAPAADAAASELESAPFSNAIVGMAAQPSGLVPVASAVAHDDAKLLRALIDTESFGHCSVVGPFQPGGGTAPHQTQVKLAAARADGIRILAHDPLAHQLGLTAG